MGLRQIFGVGIALAHPFYHSCVVAAERGRAGRRAILMIGPRPDHVEERRRSMRSILGLSSAAIVTVLLATTAGPRLAAAGPDDCSISGMQGSFACPLSSWAAPPAGAQQQAVTTPPARPQLQAATTRAG